MELQTVSHVSKTLGISAQMLRYYERSGLVKSLRKEGYAYRVYDEENIRRLQQVVVLRKLQIPLKQIKDIIDSQSAVAIVDIFKQNINGLDMQITALSSIKSILARFVEELHDKANTPLKFELLNDKTMLALTDALSFPRNNVREKLSMDELNKANEALENVLEKKPAIILFQAHMKEFQFLGVEQVVTPSTDFGMVWDNYFKIAENVELTSYTHIVWYYKNNEQIYFVGNIVDKVDELPEGYSAAKFPACEYLVVTHEWLSEGADLYTNGILLTQNYCGIGQTQYLRNGMQLPDGYERCDDPSNSITQIEIERKTKDGMRFERWIPIKERSIVNTKSWR